MDIETPASAKNLTAPFNFYGQLNLLDWTNLTGDLYDVGNLNLKDFFGKGYDQPRETAIIAVFSVLLLLGVLGNSLVCLIVLKRPKMRTPRNIFIINLAVSDLTLCLFTQPFNLVRLIQVGWNLGEIMCKLVPACSATNFYVSTISITAIALDRFQVIVYPTRDPMKTGKVVYISLILIWLLSICMALPIVFFYRLKPFILWNIYIHDVCVENSDLYNVRKIYSVASMTLLYLTPILAVSVSHVLISRKLKNRMINKKFKDKHSSRSSSKFLIKPKAGFEDSDNKRTSSCAEVRTASGDVRPTVAQETATPSCTTIKHECQFGAGEPEINMDERSNVSMGNPEGTERNNVCTERTSNTDGECFDKSRLGRLDIPVEIDSLGRTNSPSFSSHSDELFEISDENSHLEKQTQQASIHGIKTFLMAFHKDEKKPKLPSGEKLSAKQVPKLKSSLRREQRLQSHRQQLAQLGPQLQKLNQQQIFLEKKHNQTSQQLHPQDRQTFQQYLSPPEVPIIVETVLENTNVSDSACVCSSETKSIDPEVIFSKPNAIFAPEDMELTPRRKGHRSKGSFSINSFKNKLRHSKKVSADSHDFKNQPLGNENGEDNVGRLNEWKKQKEVELTALDRQRKSREVAERRKKKTNRLLLTIALVFAISWLPMNLFNLLSDFQSDFIHSLNKRSNQLLAPACLLLVLVSACVNPLLYGWLNENFRQEFQSVICCCSSVGGRSRSKSLATNRSRSCPPRLKATTCGNIC